MYNYIYTYIYMKGVQNVFSLLTSDLSKCCMLASSLIVTMSFLMSQRQGDQQLMFITFCNKLSLFCLKNLAADANCDMLISVKVCVSVSETHMTINRALSSGRSIVGLQNKYYSYYIHLIIL